MRKLFLSLLALSLFLGVVVAAAENDPTGKWTAQVPGREGQTRETTFTFKLDGDKVTGSMSGMQGAEIPISEGKMTGNTLTFVITMERGGNTMKFNYSGVLSGDEMKMKREGGQGQAREFVAKRVK